MIFSPNYLGKVNYNISLTWIVGPILGMISLQKKTVISRLRSRREVLITSSDMVIPSPGHMKHPPRPWFSRAFPHNWDHLYRWDSVLTHPHLQVMDDRWTGVAGHGRACRPRYSINIAQYWSAWWYTYPSEKWWTSSLRQLGLWHSQLNGKINMFQTTKQLMIMESMSIHVYTIYIYIYTCGIIWKAVWEWRWILDLKASILKWIRIWINSNVNWLTWI